MMYEIIYQDEFMFQAYLKAQQFTVVSKQAVLKEVFFLADEYCKVNNIGILPCDIGLYYKLMLEKYPDSKFILVDKSPVAISHVRQSTDISNAHLYITSIENFVYNGPPLDIICCFFASHLFDNSKAVIQKFSSLVCDSGHLFLLTISPDQEKNHLMNRHLATYKKNSRFQPLWKLNEQFRDAGFKVKEMVAIDFDYDLLVEDVPIAFSRYANSFLFRQSTSELELIHKGLSATAKNGKVPLDFHWSLFMLEKCGDVKNE